jgi:hypothetical protein
MWSTHRWSLLLRWDLVFNGERGRVVRKNYQPRAGHYRKHINFRGPEYFRRPAHENTTVIFVGLLTDKHMEYFRRPRARPTKITTIFIGLSQTHEIKATGPPKSPPLVARFESPLPVPRRAAARTRASPSPRRRPHALPLTVPPPARPPSEAPRPPLAAPPPLTAPCRWRTVRLWPSRRTITAAGFCKVCNCKHNKSTKPSGKTEVNNNSIFFS